MATPLLLMRPEGSFDRAGVVTPTVASGVTVVAGQVGQAWRCDASAETVTITATGHIVAAQGTMIVRGKVPAGNPATFYLLACAGSSPNRSNLGITSVGSARYILADQAPPDVSSALTDTWVTLGVTWDGTTVIRYLNGVAQTPISYSGSPIAPATPLAITALGSASVGIVESALIYDVPLTPSQIAALSQPKAWTWDMLDDGPVPGLLLPV